MTFLGFFALVLAAFASPRFAADLTGNWAVKEALGDGTVRATYLNLKQEGPRITGTIRTTQFYYRIVESTGGPDGFTNANRLEEYLHADSKNEMDEPAAPACTSTA